MHLVPNSTIQAELKKGRFILTAEKFDFDKAEIAQVAEEIKQKQELKAAREEELENKLDEDRFKEIKDDKLEIALLEEQLEGLHKHFAAKNRERDPDWVEEE
jgi:predicted HNH restriction endonuclease